MKRCLIAFFIAAQVCMAYSATADQADSTPLDNPIVAITLVELGLALNANLVSRNPNDIGKIMALFGVPYSIALTQADDSKAAKWIVPLFTAAYAAYYINLDEDKKSESDIFRENLIGMNVLIAIGIATGYLQNTDAKKDDFNSNISSSEPETIIGFYPLADGGQFRLMHRF